MGGRGNNEKFSTRKRAVNYKTSRKPPTKNPRIAHGNILLGDCNYSPIPLHHPPPRILYHNPGRHQHLHT